MKNLDGVTDIIGIIHVGANVGREVHRYETRGVKSVVWIEPIKTCFDALKKRVENCPTIESQVFNELISDVEGEELRFFEHYKSGVSSIYELNTSSEQFHGRNLNTLKVRNQTVIKAITLRSLISQNNIDLDKFNCLVVDTQGSELKVFKGLKDDIKKFKYICSEITEDNYNIYHNGCKFSELNAYLNEFGFFHDEAECVFESCKHRDIVYINKHEL